jgi:hypothetical protein
MGLGGNGSRLFSQLRHDHRSPVAGKLDDEYVYDCDRPSILVTEAEPVLNGVHPTDGGSQRATDHRTRNTIRAHQPKGHPQCPGSLAEAGRGIVGMGCERTDGAGSANQLNFSARDAIERHGVSHDTSRRKPVVVCQNAPESSRGVTSTYSTRWLGAGPFQLLVRHPPASTLKVRAHGTDSQTQKDDSSNHRGPLLKVLCEKLSKEAGEHDGRDQ